MPESINSLSPNIRDFLLNRNIISDTVTENGLDGLLVGIGVPITNIGTVPETVQASTNILDDGDIYKDLNLITNKFQGTDDDYSLVNITYNAPTNPPTSAFVYSPSYIENNGVLNDALNTPPTGPFQGGNIRQFNTSKNLYEDVDKQTLVSLGNFTGANVKYTNYQDLNADIVAKEIDILGTVLGGGQVGLNTNGGIEPNFDLRSTLVGRVLGGTGVISDTPLGQAGAKYLALALANNAAFGLQQETLGKFNINPLNIAKNGINGIIVPNYNITVPSGALGKTLDFTARVLGFESPISLFSRGSSIFTSENPVSNIERANAQLSNTGKGQVLALFGNIKSNKYRPGFKDDRIRGEGEDGVLSGDKGDGINANIYAFDTVDGGIIDFINTTTDGGDEINSPMSQSNYRLEGLIENSGFNESPHNFDAYGTDNSTTKFSWADDRANRQAKEVFDTNVFYEPKSILFKTQNLFNSNKVRTMVSGKAVGGMKPTQIMGTVQGGTISKGSGVLSPKGLDGDFSVPEEAYCRVWTTFDKYDQVQDLQKSEGINGSTAYRNAQSITDSVLGDNGFVRIAPYVGESAINAAGETNIKNYMFSIENLAWADNHADLIQCELGPGDLMTGKRGRIMWFPPYDLNVSENTSVNWESTNFIGRGEPVYTYNNAERTGTLSFKVVVDHPSYLNALKGNDGKSDEYIASFFAGCTDIDPLLAEKLTTTERDVIETRNVPPPQQKSPNEETPSITGFEMYFPNDISAATPTYENQSQEEGGGLGVTFDSGTVSFVKATSTDRNDFGLNGDKNGQLAVYGGWITPEGVAALKKALIEECPACTIAVKGHASYQGEKLNSEGNKKIRYDRAISIRQWIEKNILIDDPNIKSGRITLDDRFKPFNENDIIGELLGTQDFEIGVNDEYSLKAARKAVANFTWNADLAQKIYGNAADPIMPPPEQFVVSKKIVNRFYNECHYFEKLRQEDRFVYNSMREKLKYFHPAFHAITPEGLNSRLTFLQQCTRQGPSLINGKPDNLVFGRPPICILRLGDFYHCKIVIDNVGITYEPLVWDLNPEGIGVQPMIANVDLSFKMIGGQSMKGPINKLQNAVSFNFFANTEIYDERADRIAKTNGGAGSGKSASVDSRGNIQAPGDYEIVFGKGPNTQWGELIKEAEQGGINGQGNNTSEVDQEALNEEAQANSQEPISGGTTSSATSGATSGATSDKDILRNLNFQVQGEPSTSGGKITLTWNSDIMVTLNKTYNFNLSVAVDDTGYKPILVGKLGPDETQSSVVSSGTDWTSLFGTTAETVTNKKKTIFFKINIMVPSDEDIVQSIGMNILGVDCPSNSIYKGQMIDTYTNLNFIFTNNCI